jgi:alpha-mannosidase
VIGNGRGAENSDTSINAATLLFKGRIPAFGWSTYKVRSKQEPPAASTAKGIHTAVESDGSVTVESDLYRIRFDARQGGAIGSLLSKSLGKEFCAQAKRMNELRGYFIAQQKWCSSADSAAQIEVLEPGPLRATVRISDSVGGCKFRSTAVIVQGQERIDFHTVFQFDEDTWIGDPWDIKPQDRRKERRRSSNDGRWKLQAVFPAALDDCAVDKNSAFDVCRSRNASTHFQRWDEIKHNIITNWVDVFDAKQDLGLALFSDRTTAYSFGEGDPLGLILGWGWEAGYWWGKCPLRGEQESSYSIVPHRGLWNEAELWQQNARAEEPIVAQWMESAPGGAAVEHSYLCLTPAEAVLSAVCVNGENLEVRVFHAQDRAGAFQLRFGFPVSRAELIELDGRMATKLPVTRAEDGQWLVNVEVPGFGLRTVRASLTGRAEPIRY